jgi:hypothetical protein
VKIKLAIAISLFIIAGIGHLYVNQIMLRHAAEERERRVQMLEFVYGEIKKGARFTADDGRKICNILKRHFSVSDKELPSVCIEDR